MRSIKILSIAVSLLAASVVLAVITPSQAGTGYRIAAVPADQASLKAPLEILSISVDGKKDFLSAVEVENTSDKVIVRYSLGWHMRNAAPATKGHKAGTESYGFAVGKAVQTRLEPGSVETAPSQGVLPSDCEKVLAEKGASESVFILVGIAEVTFADGSKWSADPGDFAALRRAALFPEAPSLIRGGLIPVAMAAPPSECSHKLCWIIDGQSVCMSQECYNCFKTSASKCCGHGPVG